MNRWEELTLREKADMMKVAIRQGITNLADIRRKYNEFAEGGNLYKKGGPKTKLTPDGRALTYAIVPATGQVRWVDLNDSKDFDGVTGYRWYDDDGNMMNYTPYQEADESQEPEATTQENPYHVVSPFEKFLPDNYSVEDVNDLARAMGFDPNMVRMHGMASRLPHEWGLQGVYPEFALLTGGRGLLNGAMTNIYNAASPYVTQVTQAMKPGGSFWMNPMTKGMLYGTVMAEGVDLGTKALTHAANAVAPNYFTPADSWAQMVSNGVEDFTGWNPVEWRPGGIPVGEFLAESSNPGWFMNPESGMKVIGKVDNAAENAAEKAGRLFNSPLTGNWTRIGNREYRLNPNTLGTNGGVFESRMPVDEWAEAGAARISAENAATTTDALWDAAYNTAIESGNMAEVQRLRDLHFIAKGKPVLTQEGNMKLYHATRNRFNSFDLSKAGTGSGNTINTEGVVHLSPYKDAALDVFKTKTPEERGAFNVMELYANNPNPVEVPLETFVRSWKDASLFRSLRDAGDGIIARGESPYSLFKKAVDEYEQRKAAGTLSMFDRRPDSPRDFMEESVVDGYTINNPENIKIADAVTYDNNGNIIPLSQRDNFGINDIRYMAADGTAGQGTLEETMKAAEAGRDKALAWYTSPHYKQRLDNSVLKDVSEKVEDNIESLIKNAPFKYDRTQEMMEGVYGETTPNWPIFRLDENGNAFIDKNTGLYINIAPDLGNSADNTSLAEIIHYITANSKGSPVLKEGETLIDNGLMAPGIEYLDGSSIGTIRRSAGWQDAIIDQNNLLLPDYNQGIKIIMEKPSEAVKMLVNRGMTKEDAAKAIAKARERYAYMYDIQEQREHLQRMFIQKIQPNLKNPNDAVEIEKYLNEHPELLKSTGPLKILTEEIRPGNIKQYAKYLAEALAALPVVNSILNQE